MTPHHASQMKRPYAAHLDCGRGGRNDRSYRFPQAEPVCAWRGASFGRRHSARAGHIPCASQETLESGSFDAGLRRASARPHSKLALGARCRIWSAVAEGGTTAATAFRGPGGVRVPQSLRRKGTGGLSLAGWVSESHETHESGSFDARLRRASARPHSKLGLGPRVSMVSPSIFVII